MRRLGAELGVEAMSLYGHIAGKAAVLDGIAEFVLAEIYRNGLEAEPVVGLPWDDCIRAMARAFRWTALAHPGSFPLLLTRQIGSSAGLHPIRVVLAVFEQAGLAPDEAVHVLRAFVALLTGSLLRELGATPGLGESALDDVAARVADLQASGFPEINVAAEHIARCDHAAEFEFGVELLLSAVRLRCPPPA